jgi:hypothetical protein
MEKPHKKLQGLLVSSSGGGLVRLGRSKQRTIKKTTYKNRWFKFFSSGART